MKRRKSIGNFWITPLSGAAPNPFDGGYNPIKLLVHRSFKKQFQFGKNRIKRGRRN
jgi:hypothetical protein